MTGWQGQGAVGHGHRASTLCGIIVPFIQIVSTTATNGFGSHVATVLAIVLHRRLATIACPGISPQVCIHPWAWLHPPGISPQVCIHPWAWLHPPGISPQVCIHPWAWLHPPGTRPRPSLRLRLSLACAVVHTPHPLPCTGTRPCCAAVAWPLCACKCHSPILPFLDNSLMSTQDTFC